MVAAGGAMRFTCGMQQVDVTPMLKDDLPEVRHMLSRAFERDPIMRFVFPEESERRTGLPALMGVGVHFGFLFGEVFTTTPPVRGAAVWLPPGCSLSDERMAEAGFGDVVAEIGPEPAHRFGAIMAFMDTLHRKELEGPHWYLMIAGVDPAFQRQGIGKALLNPVLDRARSGGLPCYLETARRENVDFYQAAGFRTVVEVDAPNGGPRIWTMRRD
jgi:ribosomal protein S18 acetylase RimI-like enzyme